MTRSAGRFGVSAGTLMGWTVPGAGSTVPSAGAFAFTGVAPFSG